MKRFAMIAGITAAMMSMTSTIDTPSTINHDPHTTHGCSAERRKKRKAVKKARRKNR